MMLRTSILNPYRVRISVLLLSEGFALGYLDSSLSGIKPLKTLTLKASNVNRSDRSPHK